MELLVTIAGVVLGVAIFLPVLAKSKARSSKLGCVNNLKEIGLAFRTFAIDNNDHFPMREPVANGGTMELVSSGLVFPHFRAMSNELSTTKKLVCPNDASRTYAANFDTGLADTNLSYFVNVDAVEGNGSSLLCGDRNLKNKAQVSSRFVCVSSTSVICWTREIHWEKGNFCFADGIVATITNGAGALAVQLPTGVTNRLAIP